MCVPFCLALADVVAQYRLTPFASGQLAAYKLPQKLRLYEDQIPRNAMGKVCSLRITGGTLPVTPSLTHASNVLLPQVNKKELVKTAFPAETAA